jgi:L-asparaginase
VAVLQGRIWPALGLRKLHPYRLDTFDAGDAGALGAVEEGRVHWWRDAPDHAAWPVTQRAHILGRPVEQWPMVGIVTSHAMSSGLEVDALVQAGCQGLVIAGTGHGTIHQRLEVALAGAERRGVLIWRSTRCVNGDIDTEVTGTARAVHDPALRLTPWQARVEVMLRLAAR